MSRQYFHQISLRHGQHRQTMLIPTSASSHMLQKHLLVYTANLFGTERRYMSSWMTLRMQDLPLDTKVFVGIENYSEREWCPMESRSTRPWSRYDHPTVREHEANILVSHWTRDTQTHEGTMQNVAREHDGMYSKNFFHRVASICIAKEYHHRPMSGYLRQGCPQSSVSHGQYFPNKSDYRLSNEFSTNHNPNVQVKNSHDWVRYSIWISHYEKSTIIVSWGK